MALSGLVSYGSSDESGSDDDSNGPSVAPKIVPKAQPSTSNWNKSEPSSPASHAGSGAVHKAGSIETNKKSGSEPTRSDSAPVVGPQMAPSFGLLPRTEPDLDISSDTTAPKKSLLSALPKALNAKSRDEFEDDIEEEFKHLPKNIDLPKPPKPKMKAKISLPELPTYDSDEEDEPQAKKPKISNAGKSGLLKSLPKPVHAPMEKSTSLVPRTLNKPAVKPAPKAHKITPKIAPSISAYADSDSDDGEGSSFFSFKSSKAKTTSMPSAAPSVTVRVTPEVSGPTIPDYAPGPSVSRTFDNQLAQPGPSLPPQNYGYPSYPENAGYPDNPYDATPGQQQNDYAPNQIDFNSHQKLIQDQEFKKMVGKGFRDDALMNIIDVNAGDQFATSEELSRQLTEEKPTMSYSKKNKDAPSSQSKRKHQITYLAFQAKERELDLKNQWATNKMTKRQAQAKYGF